VSLVGRPGATFDRAARETSRPAPGTGRVTATGAGARTMTDRSASRSRRPGATGAATPAAPSRPGPAGHPGIARVALSPALAHDRSGTLPPATEAPAAVGAPADVPAPADPAPGFHGAVSQFKRRLLEATLTRLGGNRTRAARALGLQRTYLLRLIREFGIDVPATPGHPRGEPVSHG
jgi:hypothetical protein